jgi:hypothetical protein
MKPTAKLEPIQRAFMLGFRYDSAAHEWRCAEVDDAIDRLEATNAPR